MSTNNMTVMFWHRLTAEQTAEYSTYFTVGDDWNDDQPAWTFFGQNPGTPTPAIPTIYGEAFDGNNAWGPSNYIDLSGGNAVTVNSWHHYAYTKAGDEHKWYVDANLVANGTLTQPENTDSWANGYELFGASGVDEGNWVGARLRMWTRALTANEIYTEAQSPSAVNSTSLFRDILFMTANGADMGAGNNYLVLVGNVQPWPSANTQDVEFIEWG